MNCTRYTKIATRLSANSKTWCRCRRPVPWCRGRDQLHRLAGVEPLLLNRLGTDLQRQIRHGPIPTIHPFKERLVLKTSTLRIRYLGNHKVSDSSSCVNRPWRLRKHRSSSHWAGSSQIGRWPYSPRRDEMNVDPINGHKHHYYNLIIESEN